MSLCSTDNLGLIDLISYLTNSTNNFAVFNNFLYLLKNLFENFQQSFTNNKKYV